MVIVTKDPEQSDPTPAQRPSLDALTDAVLASYDAEPDIQHIGATFLPSRGKAIGLLLALRELIFPGFFGQQKLDADNLRFHVGEMLQGIRTSMEQQVDTALRYAENLAADGRGDACQQCTAKARQITDAFLQGVGELRRRLALDIEAAYGGDPAARNTDETIFCYPGVFAIFTHRVAHELHRLGVPLLPRILSEYAHGETGIDIHPAATIGDSFFIDHGTGVVIGETSVIGDNVRLYQGVTLGAPAWALSAEGRGRKRHPTVEDDVTIYANATILGGNVIIGRGSVIGGGVFLTRSVPPGHSVTTKSLELKFKAARGPVKLPPDPDQANNAKDTK